MAPLTSDQLVDRRRLQRRLSAWRAFAFAALVFAIVVIGWRVSGLRGGAISIVPHIARIHITGLITGDRDTIKLIDDIAKSSASAVLVDIDSPGGTTTGSERIFDALRRLSAKKPTVAVVGTLAASGAYIAAIGTDHIVSLGNSLVGSIGVLFEFPNVGDALGKIGVKVETIKSTPLKAAPNGFEPTTPEARAAIASLVTDSYAWFKGLVKTRRGYDDQQLAAVDDGRVFTGRQALQLKLVDQIGEEEDALKYLHDKRGISKNLSVRDWKPTSGFGRLRLFTAAGSVLRFFHLGFAGGTLEALGRVFDEEAPAGLLALWQVS